MITIIFQNGEEVNLDVSDHQDYDYPTRSTDHRTEQGSVISDHLINDPINININGFITDVSESISETDRHLSIKERFIGARDRKELVTLETDRGKFENVSFTFKDTVEIETGLCFVIDLHFKEIRIGVSKTEKSPKSAKGKGDPGDSKAVKTKKTRNTQDNFSSKKSLGVKPTKAPTDAQNAVITPKKQETTFLYDAIFGGG